MLTDRTGNQSCLTLEFRNSHVDTGISRPWALSRLPSHYLDADHRGVFPCTDTGLCAVGEMQRERVKTGRKLQSENNSSDSFRFQKVSYKSIDVILLLYDIIIA